VPVVTLMRQDLTRQVAGGIAGAGPPAAGGRRDQAACGWQARAAR